MTRRVRKAPGRSTPARAAVSEGGSGVVGLKRYAAPKLTACGRLIDVTFGGSPGAGDSGGGALIQNPFSGP